METTESVFIFHKMETNSLYQAFVAIDYYMIAHNGDHRYIDGANAKRLEEIYQEAVRKQFIPRSINEKEKEHFLAKSREYRLIVIEEGEQGFLGLAKKPYTVGVQLTENCLHCHGKLLVAYQKVSEADHEKSVQCSRCKKATLLQPPKEPEPHGFGSMVTRGCRDVKKCQKCEYSKTIALHHHFGEWQASSQSPCTQTRACSACSASEQREEHSERVLSQTIIERGWNDWMDIPRNTVEKWVECVRCGKRWSYVITQNE